MTKRTNPYTRLKLIAQQYIFDIKHRKAIPLWWHRKEDLGDGWSLEGLYQRVLAAKQLGYSVELRADKKGLDVVYVKDMPRTPWELQ